MAKNLRGEDMPDITLRRAQELNLGLETVIIRGVGRATGYAGRIGRDRIELGERVRDWMWWIKV